MTRGRSLHFPSRPPSPVRRPQRGTAVAGTGAGAGEERPSHSAASTEAQAQTPSQASRATASAVMAGQVGGAGAGMGLSAERSRGDPGVYLQEPPLQFNLPGATGVMYDEALSMLLVASHSRVSGLVVWDSTRHHPMGTSCPRQRLSPRRFPPACSLHWGFRSVFHTVARS